MLRLLKKYRNKKTKTITRKYKRKKIDKFHVLGPMPIIMSENIETSLGRWLNSLMGG